MLVLCTRCMDEFDSSTILVVHRKFLDGFSKSEEPASSMCPSCTKDSEEEGEEGVGDEDLEVEDELET